MYKLDRMFGIRSGRQELYIMLCMLLVIVRRFVCVCGRHDRLMELLTELTLPLVRFNCASTGCRDYCLDHIEFTIWLAPTFAHTQTFALALAARRQSHTLPLPGTHPTSSRNVSQHMPGCACMRLDMHVRMSPTYIA